jgi:hypothetical protein
MAGLRRGPPATHSSISRAKPLGNQLQLLGQHREFASAIANQADASLQQDSRGEDAGQFAESLVGCQFGQAGQVSQVVGRAHGTSPVGIVAHSDLRLATGTLSGGDGKLTASIC